MTHAVRVGVGARACQDPRAGLLRPRDCPPARPRPCARHWDADRETDRPRTPGAPDVRERQTCTWVRARRGPSGTRVGPCGRGAAVLVPFPVCASEVMSLLWGEHAVCTCFSSVHAEGWLLGIPAWPRSQQLGFEENSWEKQLFQPAWLVPSCSCARGSVVSFPPGDRRQLSAVAAARSARGLGRVRDWQVRALWAELGWAPRNHTRAHVAQEALTQWSQSWLWEVLVGSGLLRALPRDRGRRRGGDLALGPEA